MNNHLEIVDRSSHHLSDTVTNPIYRVSCAPRYFSQAVLGLLLTFAVLSSVPGCGSLRLNPDPEVAPSPNFTRVWSPSGSVSAANEAAPKLSELRTIDENKGLPQLNPGGYDLPALVDLALGTNPQTRRAWYAAQAADAQLGQSQAANYPKVSFDGEGGYLKLPIQFPGQTLVVRNEAFLPQVKASYDLLDFGRTRAAEHGAREQLIAANFAFNRAIQDVISTSRKATTSCQLRKRASARLRPISHLRIPVSPRSTNGTRWAWRLFRKFC
jgi:outer membrane efflux protein